MFCRVAAVCWERQYISIKVSYTGNQIDINSVLLREISQILSSRFRKRSFFLEVIYSLFQGQIIVQISTAGFLWVLLGPLCVSHWIANTWSTKSYLLFCNTISCFLFLYMYNDTYHYCAFTWADYLNRLAVILIKSWSLFLARRQCLTSAKPDFHLLAFALFS